MTKKWIWCDLEMTGLDPAKKHIIEIATIITDDRLNIVAEGPNLIVWQPAAHLQNLDPWIMKHHGVSGLLEAVRNSRITLEEAEKETLAFIEKHVDKNESPLCGNSIGTDRIFLSRYMPRIAGYLNYRSVDVSSVKILAKAWFPNLEDYKKQNNHRALDDIKESIAELRYYRKHIFANQG